MKMNKRTLLATAALACLASVASAQTAPSTEPLRIGLIATYSGP